jgi:hypothetical protein
MVGKRINKMEPIYNMKQIFTLILTFIVSVSIAQTRYFKTEVKYVASDNCTHYSIITSDYLKGSPNFDEVYKDIKGWVRPYKIKKGTFEITSITIVKKNDKRNEKFKPCCKIPKLSFNLDNTLSSLIFKTDSLHPISTSLTSSNLGISLSSPTYNILLPTYSFQSNYKTILTVSSPDSLGTISVKFWKNSVKMVNDSTFTYHAK